MGVPGMAAPLLLLLALLPPSQPGAVVFDPDTIDQTVASYEFVFINFYADWCRFSNLLAPVWDEGADLITKELTDQGKSVIVGKVDCDKHGELGTKYGITKYPTIKYIRNGEVGKKEYRGQRSAEGFLDFVKEQIKDPVVEIQDLQELNSLEDSKAYVLGYFEQRGTLDHQNYRKAALSLKDTCQFYAGFGEVVERMHPPSHDIVAFRPAKARTNDEDEAFTGELRNYDTFLAWVQEKCNPVVREITFENAEELTEEGLPFLILFHHPDDTDSVKEYNDLVQRELLPERAQVTFLTADGVKFAHPLHHLGKSKDDLPLIAIDSFRHMYLFPKFADSRIPGRINQFLARLYSGQLHREFHYGPDEDEEKLETNEIADSTGHIPRQEEGRDRVKRGSGPVDSQFQHLKPSDNRYSFRLRDEF